MPLVARFILVLLFVLPALALTAQTTRADGMARYVEEHNDRVASYDWVKTVTGKVQFEVIPSGELVAYVNEHLRITLQRETDDAMDYLFPLTIDSATVLLTNTTAVFIDAGGQFHLALSILDEPRLPRIEGEPLLLFTGNGLGRERVVE